VAQDTLPYRERLWPPWWGWLLAVVWPAMLGVAYGYATSAWVGWLVGGGAVGLALFGLREWSVSVQVDRDGLTAGRVQLPAACIGGSQALDGVAASRLRGVEADARAHLVVRGWVPGGVRLEVTDPLDPTPYWFVSSRRPDALSRALEQARTAG
jgi:hypothetical protein